MALTEAAKWVQSIAGLARPVLVAYPLSFDWAWLYWYFIRFSKLGSPFDYSRCFDIKTAYAVKAGVPISAAGRRRLPSILASRRPHTHHAVDDAIEQAEVFANIFEWEDFLGEIESRRKISAQRSKELISGLTDARRLVEDKACIYATGSFGRVEASINSDLDLHIVGKDCGDKGSALGELNGSRVKDDIILTARKEEISGIRWRVVPI